MGQRTRLTLILSVLVLAASGPAAVAAQEQPNVVVVMTDDQRLWDMEAMPLTNRLLGERGTTFTNAFATNPLCCPSRATFLSGQYAHNHGVLDNDLPEGGYEKFDFSNALGVWLQQAGYRTAHIGKQLNEYGVAYRPNQVTIAPGYDDWFATRDPTTYSMYNYVVQDNALRRPYGVLPEDYQTDVLANRALEDIRNWAPDDRPFFIHLSTGAIHHEIYDAEAGPRPAPGIWAPSPTSRFSRVRTTTRPTSRTSPASSAITRGSSPSLAAKIADSHTDRLESLLAVDEAVARIVEELERLGELDQTLLVFTSDNGYLHGEHRFPNQKVVPYEESIRVPLIVRGPGFPAGAIRRQLVGNIDLAPTILELAGATPGRAIDGESLVRYAQKPRHRRDRSLALESDFDAVGGTPALIIPAYHQGVHVYYDGIRTRRYKYVHWFRDVDGNPANEEELYDLAADPYELESLHDSPRHAALKRALARELETFKDCAGRDCRRAFDPPPVPCVRTPLRISGGAAGALAVGATKSSLLTDAGSPKRVRKRAWRYCAQSQAGAGAGTRRGGVHVVFSPASVARLVAIAAPARGVRGIKRGTPISRLERAYPQARRLVPGLFGATPERGPVFGVEDGRVRFVALADAGLRDDPRRLARHLRRAGL